MKESEIVNRVMKTAMPPRIPDKVIWKVTVEDLQDHMSMALDREVTRDEVLSTEGIVETLRSNLDDALLSTITDWQHSL